jgi:hypothetical protein
MEKKYSNKSLMDKLGLAPGARVALLGIADPDFLKQLRSRTGEIYEGRLKKETDAIFLAADDIKALERLTHLRSIIKSNGAVWVVSLKGKQARIKDVDVISAALKAGFVDVKVVSFSDTHTALKLVIPVAQRPK